MNVSLGLLVSLLQVNIASGFFYVGLRTARYRNKLYAHIVDVFNSTFMEFDKKAWLEEYNRQRTINKELSDKHFEVAKWLIELPSDYKRGLRHARIRECFEGAQNAEKMPPFYRWYRKNYDRWITFLVCSVLPIAIIWGLSFRETPLESDTSTVLIILSILLGHLCAAGHVLMGWLIVVDGYQNKFSQMIEELLRFAPASRVPQQVEKFTTPEPAGNGDNGDAYVPELWAH